MPPGRVQDELRRCFRRWGRPLSVRVDNGNPWGSCGDLPTPLALWLIGLGVGVIWNPPRTAAGQRRGGAEPGAGQELGRAGPLPRRRRSCNGGWTRRTGCSASATRTARSVSRMEAYPGVAHSGRPYSAAWERRALVLGAVLSDLAGAMVPRRVDRSGKIGLYHGKLYVGTVNRGKEVVVQFDAGAAEWVISDPSGVELCRRPLDQFDEAGLRRLPDSLISSQHL